MTMTDRLVGVWAKIARAKQHIAEVEVARAAFAKSHPCRVGTKRDPDTREIIYYVESAADVPIGVRIAAGDAINSLGCALDHLAYQLVEVGTGTTPTNVSNLYFPITSDSPTLDKAFTKGEIKHARLAVQKAIKAIEPYKGGKGHQLWVLHKLNNIDKHRLLLAAQIHFTGPTLGSLIQPGMQLIATISDDGSVRELPLVPQLARHTERLKPAGGIRPLKTGDELMRGAPGLEANDYANFGIEIAITEPEIGKCEPMLEMLHHFADIVSGIVLKFEPFL
jgi:hypothetical protein